MSVSARSCAFKNAPVVMRFQECARRPTVILQMAIYRILYIGSTPNLTKAYLPQGSYNCKNGERAEVTCTRRYDFTIGCRRGTILP